MRAINVGMSTAPGGGADTGRVFAGFFAGARLAAAFVLRGGGLRPPAAAFCSALLRGRHSNLRRSAWSVFSFTPSSAQIAAIVSSRASYRARIRSIFSGESVSLLAMPHLQWMRAAVAGDLFRRRAVERKCGECPNPNGGAVRCQGKKSYFMKSRHQTRIHTERNALDCRPGHSISCHKIYSYFTSRSVPEVAETAMAEKALCRVAESVAT